MQAKTLAGEYQAEERHIPKTYSPISIINIPSALLRLSSTFSVDLGLDAYSGHRPSTTIRVNQHSTQLAFNAIIVQLAPPTHQLHWSTDTPILSKTRYGLQKHVRVSTPNPIQPNHIFNNNEIGRPHRHRIASIRRHNATGTART